jgi:hypothetical protein
MGFKQRRAKSEPVPFDKAVKSCTVFLSHATYDLIKQKSDKVGLPMGKLIAYAIDKELDRENAFNYPCEMPKNEFIEGAYTDEASKIYRYLKRTAPQSIDELMLNRRDIGIESKETMMLAIRELMANEYLVRPVYPMWRSKKFPYSKEFKVLMPIESTDEKKAKRLAKLKEEIEFLEKGGILE